MRSPDEQQLALECLRLAIAAHHGDAVEEAREYFAFVTGEDKAGDPPTEQA